MSPTTNAAVHQWIEEAGAAMGGGVAERREALLELESTIYEKVEEQTSGGVAENEAVGKVLASLGSASAMGHACIPQTPVIRAELTRSFFMWTWALFAVHFVLIIAATMAGRDFALPPLHFRPIEQQNALELFARALEVLLFDAGLMMLIFVCRDRLGGLLPSRTAPLRDREPRRHFESAAFMALVLIVANFLRDNLLALYLRDGTGMIQVPLLGEGFTDNLVLFNVWLVLACARELWYGFRGENRRTLLLDIGVRAIGVFCLLRIVASQRIVDLAGAQESLGPNADTVAALLNTAFSLIALVAAATIAVEIVRRAFRLRLAD